MPNHAPRISLSYADASGVLQAWSQSCQQIIAYEHEADAECSRTHLHVLMCGSSVKSEALKRQLYKLLPQEHRKGNDLWSWEHDDWKKKNPGKEYDEGMITYMAKGTLRPIFNKNFPADIVEKRTLEWVEPTSQDKLEKYDEYKEMLKDAMEVWMLKRPSLDLIRSWTMRWYWQRDGRLPNAGCYKRNAASVFLHLMEQREAVSPNDNSFSVALEQVKNLWY